MITLRGFKKGNGIKNDERWVAILKMDNSNDLKDFFDDNSFKLSDILSFAVDGGSQNVSSDELWARDLGFAQDGFYHSLVMGKYFIKVLQ